MFQALLFHHPDTSSYVLKKTSRVWLFFLFSGVTILRSTFSSCVHELVSWSYTLATLHLLGSVSDVDRCCFSRKEFYCLLWSSRNLEVVELTSTFLLFNNVPNTLFGHSGRLAISDRPDLFFQWNGEFPQIATKCKFKPWNQILIFHLLSPSSLLTH